MLTLPDSWVWDFWIADDGERYHLFFLFASRALGEPDLRHGRAAAGHAVSTDLVHWDRVADALVHGEAGEFDDTAIWTGSIVQGEDGTWHIFYTGTRRIDGQFVQTVGRADSADLMAWSKRGQVLTADTERYETLGSGEWPDEHFRDPWVLRGEDGLWHMLVTARANHGPAQHRGVVAHATSPDLETWTHRDPASTPDAGFGQLEVVQPFSLGGRWWLLFNCLGGEIDQRVRPSRGGIWVAPADGPTGPFDIASATLLSGPELYVGKVLEDRTGNVVLLAFHNEGADGAFVGSISDPIPIEIRDGVPSLVRTER